MPTITKSPNVKGQKPWQQQGISYQQWYYQNKQRQQKGLIEQASGRVDTSSLTENQPPPTSHQSDQNGVLRDAVLTAEFLDRCEMQGTITEQVILSPAMATALYNTLRTDGH